MRSRFDQAIKELLHDALAPLGTFTTELEVSPDPQRVDGWFVPDPKRLESAGVELGLLGRMCRAACAFEAFTTAPGEADLVACVRKLLNLRHIAGRKGPPEAEPALWILCSGRPTSALGALFARKKQGFPRGVYAIPPAFHTTIVVVSELPEDRSTLLVRLAGRGRTLRRALKQLFSLPEDAFERSVALPIVLSYGLELIEAGPAKRTQEDEEFLMDSKTKVKEWERRIEERGIEKGIEKGALQSLTRMFERRLARPLTVEERSLLASRIHEQGIDQVSDVVLDLSPQDLATWLAGKNAA